MRSRFRILLTVATCIILFCSCSVQKRQHRDGFHVQLFQKHRTPLLLEGTGSELVINVKKNGKGDFVVENQTSKESEECAGINVDGSFDHSSKSRFNISKAFQYLPRTYSSLDIGTTSISTDYQIYKKVKQDGKPQDVDKEEDSNERKNWLGSIGGWFSAIGFFSFLIGAILIGQNAGSKLVLAFGVLAPPILVGLGLLLVAASFFVMRKKKQSKETKKASIINQILGYATAALYVVVVHGMGIFSAFAFPAGWALLAQISLAGLLMAVAGALLFNLIALIIKITSKKNKASD
ncbi:MAG: hypothetical protein ACJAZ2_002234 [Glaciecola sp.]|jgi:hypothetical protein